MKHGSEQPPRNGTPQDEKSPIENLAKLSDSEFEDYVREFLGETIKTLPQEEVDTQVASLLTELASRNINGFHLFSFALPDTATAEEIQSGNTPAAKVYRALFNFSATRKYKETPEIQMVTRELENIVDQNPQMIGPVALWQIAKDVMWRRDIPSHAKGSLAGSMTYALAFFDQSEYGKELLKQLDLEHTEKYGEVAHMLEALKYFWSAGHESFAEKRAPRFYLGVLEQLKETPQSNYLLSVRAREILAMLKKSDDFPNETRDIVPFELSQGIYASTQNGEGLTIVPTDQSQTLLATIAEFNENEEQLVPPQWMIDEAIQNGESWVTWQPPRETMQARQTLLKKMHSLATVPIEKMVGEMSASTPQEKNELLFDYEYLVSKPVRELIQKEFDFELKDLAIREQFYFLNYLKGVTIENVEPLKQFAKTYGTDGLRTFLSLEHDRGFGSSIIALGEKLPQESARALFKKYGELLDAAHEAESYVEHAFGKKGNKELVGTISKNLLVKAVKLLKESSQNLDSAPDIKTAEAQIAERLKMIESATELFLSTFKTLATSGESISLAEIRELSFEHINPADLSPDDKATMRSIYAQNYQATPELQHELLANFDIATSGEDPSASDKPLTFYTLRHNNRIVAFCAFTEYEYRKIRFSMMNIDPHYQNNALGQTFLDKTLAMESPFGRIDAACDACSPAARHYIEKGFVGKRSFTYHEIQALDILFLDKAIARTWTPEMVIARAHPDAHADSDGILVVVAQTPHELPFDLLNKGKILSRYFKKDDRYYAVFEDPAPQEPGAIVV